MSTLNVLCAGAAQAVTEKIVVQFERQTGHRVQVAYDAVNALKAKLLEGAPADAVILSAPLIEELIASGHLAPGSRADLGKVGTGVAVKAGTPLPDVSNAEVLRGNILAARRLYFPDPQRATAGKVVMGVLDRLGITEELRGRFALHPNGYAAMKAMAASDGVLMMGITQVTEILANPGVKLVGALPGELAVVTTYSAGVVAATEDAAFAREFVKRLTGFTAQPLLLAAGYQIGG
ncbi:MAG: molybdate ABC transporter substrate-binding protein [Burkholderiales bacterium]